MPCRTLCQRAKDECHKLMEIFGVAWPDDMECSRCVILLQSIDKPAKIQRVILLFVCFLVYLFISNIQYTVFTGTEPAVCVLHIPQICTVSVPAASLLLFLPHIKPT